MPANMRVHQLSQLPDKRYTCSVCLWVWQQSPRSRCPGVPHYAYGQWPPGLYTFTQLRRMKLRPGDKADGCYFIGKAPYRRYLYDIGKAIHRRIPTERQREAIEKMRAGLLARHTCKRCGYYDKSQGKGKYGQRVLARNGYCEDCNQLIFRRQKQAEVCAWANTIMQRPDQFVVLDSETTGLDQNDEIIELAIVSASGTLLFNSLIQPQDLDSRWKAGKLATHIHGITREMLHYAPTFEQVWPRVCAILRHYRRVLVYNASFDQGVLEQTARRYGHRVPQCDWQCIMEQYAAYHGVWSSYWGSTPGRS